MIGKMPSASVVVALDRFVVFEQQADSLGDFASTLAGMSAEINASISPETSFCAEIVVPLPPM